jgi:putative nucleotidyltransferase with HDIG domain
VCDLAARAAHDRHRGGVVTDPVGALERSSVVEAARSALAGTPAWLVGGPVRDAFLGRPIDPDVDIVVGTDARDGARRLASAADAHVFALSERFGAWRVIARDRSWQADLTPLRGDSIEADLALRDFTVNAMARPLGDVVTLIDPHGGEVDLVAGALRAVTEQAFADDPLRVLRLARFAPELGLAVEPRTMTLAQRAAPRIREVAAERAFYELRRLVAGEDPVAGIRLVGDVGLMPHLLPELHGLEGVEQNPYHHLDVWGHTLEVLERLVEIERDPQSVFGDLADPIAAELGRPLADDLTRAGALRFGALLHDVGKPATRAVSPDGRVLFWGHDGVGADIARAVFRRLRASTSLADFVAALAQHHLRLGFLVHERPLTRRHVYAYMRACEPVELEVTVLSAADRLSTRGTRSRNEALEAHLDLARELAAAALDWRAHPPVPPLRGEELMDELQLTPGPEVGKLLRIVEEAAFAGEANTREEALAVARRASAALSGSSARPGA